MLDAKYNFIGIDYGSKLAGTTVISYAMEDKLQLEQSRKKTDADDWLIQRLSALSPGAVYFDAPLSLPAAFYGKGDNYFYRDCDRMTKAMSPMFLGGLTARAIKLKHRLEEVDFFECYPGYLAREVLQISRFYTKKQSLQNEAIDLLEKLLPLPMKRTPENWHQFDAVLAWITGHRMQEGQALFLGDPGEGQIVI